MSNAFNILNYVIQDPNGFPCGIVGIAVQFKAEAKGHLSAEL
jgi:hypothetical protein